MEKRLYNSPNGVGCNHDPILTCHRKDILHSFCMLMSKQNICLFQVVLPPSRMYQRPEPESLIKAIFYS